MPSSMEMELPNFRATGIGSTPHTEPRAAVDFVLADFKDLPFWPQLPRRSFRENMYAQYTEHMPGVVLEQEAQQIWVDLGEGWLDQAEEFYSCYLQEDPNLFATSPDYAAGLHEFLRRGPQVEAWAVKGQLTGPNSIGLQVADEHRRPVLYDEMMRDVIIKSVLRSAQWQEAELREICPRTFLFVDEPMLSMVGSAYVAISPQDVSAALEEVFAGLMGLTGTHCCGNTDWGLLLATSVDVLSFDAYEHAENLSLYAEDLRHFLDRGGMLAWGVIPNTGEGAASITLDEARGVLERALSLFDQKGFSRDELLSQSFVTPACGTGTLTVPTAERVMRLTRELSDRVREEHGLG